jgi:flagellar assembly protein FliH
MMGPEKFAFDTEFDENGEILREGESYKRFYTADDVEAARMWGVEEGRMGEEGRAADALEAVGAQMRLILARLTTESDQLRQEAARFALVVASKISGAALTHFPQEAIAEAAEEALQDLRSEPRFYVRCAPELVEAVAERLEETAREAGFEGAVVVRGEAGLQGADCRLEWGAGAIQRNQDEIETRLDEIVERWLTAAFSEDEAQAGPDVSAA